MKPYMKIKNEKFGSRKGQALVELAVFSSLFLFTLAMLIQYGLNFNYQQEHNMVAFRKALDQASSAGEHAQQGSVVTVNDRAYPDPQDESGVSQHYPVSASAGVLWSNKLQGRLEYNLNLDKGTADDRPRLVMEVNNARVPGSDEQGQLYTAGYKEQSLTPTDSVGKLKVNEPDCNSMDCQNVNDIYTGNFSDWQYISMDMGNVNVVECGGCAARGEDPSTCRDPEYCDKPEDSHYTGTIIDKAAKDLDIGSSGEIDVDGDGKIETVLPLNKDDIGWIDQGTTVNGGYETYKVYKYYVKRLRVFDNQAGTIDLTADKPQGIQPGYNRQMRAQVSNSSENNWLQPNVINNTSDISSQERISRKLLLNNPGGAAIESTVNSDFNTDTQETWTTKNE